MSQSKMSTPRVAQRERRKAVWDLRKQGLSTTQIGEQLGIAQSTAWRDLVAMWAEFAPAKEDADVLRREQHGRLVHMLEPLLPGVEAGDLAVIDRVLKIEARIAALWGLDRPVERTDTGPQTAIQINLGSFGAPADDAIEQPAQLPPDT